MTIIFIPVLVMLLGLVVYLVTAHPKAQEVGRLAFFAGLLVTLFDLANHALRLT